MLTLQQITTAHAKVKSGAAFPAYIQEIKELGVCSFIHFVGDGHIEYFGEKGFTILADAESDRKQIAQPSSIENLKQALAIHQQGQTDYLTFCQQSAEAGVEKWIVDLVKMTCVYYDSAGNEMVTEIIPSA